jgi:hypothetical protein
MSILRFSCKLKDNVHISKIFFKNFVAKNYFYGINF